MSIFERWLNSREVIDNGTTLFLDTHYITQNLRVTFGELIEQYVMLEKKFYNTEMELKFMAFIKGILYEDKMEISLKKIVVVDMEKLRVMDIGFDIDGVGGPIE